VPLEAQARAMHFKVQKNLNFAIARGLTNTARFAAQKMQQQLPAIFDRPTPFTQRAIGSLPATKTRLEARVFVRDVQAQYLMPQEHGRLRQPMPGSPINIAVGQRLNPYGNISRGAIAKLRAKPNVFFSKGKGKTKQLPPGLYERLDVRRKKGMGSRRGRKVTTGRGNQKTRLNMLVAFERQASYQPRFRFSERVIKIARNTIQRELQVSVADAMRTMR
jgi:hypothetical protein